jgi:hypothetical protein
VTSAPRPEQKAATLFKSSPTDGTCLGAAARAVRHHRPAHPAGNLLLADHLIPVRRSLQGELEDIKSARSPAGVKGNRTERRLTEVQKLLEELSDFIARVTEVAEKGPPPSDSNTVKREADARYSMDLADGVMVNSAALWPLVEPQWKEPKKWWGQLANRSGPKGRFAHGTDACIVCTSTLELGIDVGDLDAVFQANAPSSVSSFMQRMGRTGRRSGTTPNTTFLCEDPEAVLQAVALLVHQLLAMSLQFGAISSDAGSSSLVSPTSSSATCLTSKGLSAGLAALKPQRERTRFATASCSISRAKTRHVGHALSVRRLRFTWHRSRRAGQVQDLIDAAVGIDSAQLDLVALVGNEIEDAARELRGDGAPGDDLGTNAKKRHRLLPCRRPHRAVAHRDARVLVVVPRDEQLHTEGDDRRPIELRGTDLQNIVSAQRRCRQRERERGPECRRKH